MSEAINYMAMVLSVVSLIVTVLGFFASLKFYRDGMELQNKANDALTKIEEKTQFIQTQVGGMFDKTLDAAIGKREALSESFAELNEQLETTKAKIIEESLTQIGAAGEQERKRIKGVIDSQIEEIKQKVESTRESAEQAVENKHPITLTPEQRAILSYISRNTPDPTRDEIIGRLELESSIVDHNLRVLQRYGLIKRVGDKYIMTLSGFLH